MSGAKGLALRMGEKVLIDGRRAEARDFVDDGRVFLFAETGDTRVYSNVAQVRMTREGRLTTQAALNLMSPGRREALDTDLAAFAPEMRDLILWRRRFVMAIEALPQPERRTRAGIDKAIDAVQKELTEAAVEALIGAGGGGAPVKTLRPRPSVRMVGDWHATFIGAGRDVRALVDLSYRKGRGDQLPPWIREEVRRAIDAVYATQPPGSYADTRLRAITLIRARAVREGIPVPIRGKHEPIGVNTVKRVIESDYEEYEVLVRRLGKAEADRIMEAVENGPKASWPLHQVEVDHTALDILVVDPSVRTVIGRPWLTVLRDRFSGCIVGFCLSFHPPSWTTVMEALRIAVVDKGAMLAELGGIENAWDCCGAPDELISDNGKEFHSASMEAVEAALNMRIFYMPRGKGWLKGRVERWFGTLERQVVHRIAGTTLSNVLARKHYDAQAAAVMTIDETQWIVAKWIVDVYHQDDHDGAIVPPARRWAAGVHEHGPKVLPPQELLSPLTGLTVEATLTREGVRAKCLRWNSNAFSALRNRIGTNVQVKLKIDTMDLRHASVLDPERLKWVVGDLKTEDVGAHETLHQYEVIRTHAKRTQDIGEDKRAALARARGEIFDYVEEVIAGRAKSKAGKRFLRFVSDGRKPHEHIAASRQDAEASARPLGSHRVGRKAKPTAPMLAEATPPAASPPAKRRAAEAAEPPVTPAIGPTDVAPPTTNGVVRLPVIIRRPRRSGR